MEKDRKVIELNGDLRVRNLTDIRSTLLSADASDLDLDLNGVAEFDTAALQLLLSLRKELSSREGSVIISRASEPVRQIISFYGAQDLFGEREVSNG